MSSFQDDQPSPPTPSSALPIPGASKRSTAMLGLAVEPPLPLPVSSSSSSSPIRPLFSWPSAPAVHLLSSNELSSETSPPRATHPTLPHASTSSPSVILNHPRPTSPPHLTRDPFDDGVSSFAEDPFALDGSDPEETGLARVDVDPEGGEEVKSSPSRIRPRPRGVDIHRSETGETSESGTGGDSAGEGGGEFADVLDGSTPVYGFPGGGAGEEDDLPPVSAACSPGSLHPPSPPPFIRAWSAPVASAKLGNLVHPSRRPSQSISGGAFFRPPLNSPQTSFQSNASALSDSAIQVPLHQPSLDDPTSGVEVPSLSSSTLGSSNSTTHAPGNVVGGEGDVYASSQASASNLSLSSSLISSLSAPNIASGLFTLSLELADSVQAAIQTLLQITPPHLFDTAKEQFSACTVQMPTTTLTSLLTAMKNLNYLSEHIAPLYADDSAMAASLHQRRPFSASDDGDNTPKSANDPSFRQDGTASSASWTTKMTNPLSPSAGDFPVSAPLSPFCAGAPTPIQSFDIGEMVQSVGDLLGGLTAEAGVDLVLFHGDVGMKHISVCADEGGLCYVLSHVVRQILLTSRPGDAIEIGLHVQPHSLPSPSTEHELASTSDLPNNDSEVPRRPRPLSLASDSSIDSATAARLGGAYLCSFEIVHNLATKEEAPAQTPLTEKAGSHGGFPGFSFPGEGAAATSGLEAEEQPLPPLPALDSQLTTKLVRHIGGVLSAENNANSTCRKFELTLLLDRGSPLVEPAQLSAEEEAVRQPFPALKLAREPTLVELHAFAESLRGQRVALHAGATSVFAKHLTSYLTAWGMDMRHISTEGEEDEAKDLLGPNFPGPSTNTLGRRGDSGYGGSSSGGSSPLSGSTSVMPGEYGTAGAGEAATIGGGPAAGGFGGLMETVPSLLSASTRSKTSLPGTLGTLSENLESSTSSGDLPRLSTIDIEKEIGSFIIIDDDLSVLRRRLVQIRHAHAAAVAAPGTPNLTLRPRSSLKRPSLASRARSSPQIRQLLPMTQEGSVAGGPGPPPDSSNGSGSFSASKRGVVILHFTSLANYSRVRDVVQSILTPGSATGLPEVMVIPKPIGPRRFLTALHTAVHRPIVDPYFTPIATSPLNPSGTFGQGNFGYFPPPPAATAPQSSALAFHTGLGAEDDQLLGQPSIVSGRPSSSRAVSNASSASGTGSSASKSAIGGKSNLSLGVAGASASSPAGSVSSVRHGGRGQLFHLALPSPSVTDPIEFLADTAGKLGQSARSGMLIQSPDGMPMGMFFDPLPRTPNSRRSSLRSGGSLGGDGKDGSNTGSSERRKSTAPVRPPIATFTSSLEGIIKSASLSGNSLSSGAISSGAAPARQQRSVTELVNMPTSPNRRESLHRSRLSGENFGHEGPSATEEKRRTSTSSQTSAGGGGVSSFAKSPGGGGGGSGSAPGSTPGSTTSRAGSTPSRDEAVGQLHRTNSTSRRPKNVSVSSAGGGAPAPGVLPHRTSGSAGSAGSVGRARSGTLSASASNSAALADDEAAVPARKSPSLGSGPGSSVLSSPKGAGGEPVMDAPPAPVPAKTARKTERAKKKATKEGEGTVVPPINVLIVEDNPINQTILSTFMKKRKIKYGVAKDGLEAVEKWRTGGFHLILMDIQLPVMDGIEATREIRKLEKYHNIGIFPSTPTIEHIRTPSPSKEQAPSSPFRSSVIIVALTASAQPSDRVSALAAGCNDFLTKPVSLKWLETKIVEWGCMQALIDFDGWRRWRTADVKITGSNSASEAMAKGFGSLPDAQGRAMRSRLKIARSTARSSPSQPASQLTNSSIDQVAVDSVNLSPQNSSPTAQAPPEISIQTATPRPAALETQPVPASGEEKKEGKGGAAIKADEVEDTVSLDALPSRPASPPIDPGRVSSETLANVPVSGFAVLDESLQEVKQEQEHHEKAFAERAAAFPVPVAPPPIVIPAAPPSSSIPFFPSNRRPSCPRSQGSSDGGASIQSVLNNSVPVGENAPTVVHSKSKSSAGGSSPGPLSKLDSSTSSSVPQRLSIPENQGSSPFSDDGVAPDRAQDLSDVLTPKPLPHVENGGVDMAE